MVLQLQSNLKQQDSELKSVKVKAQGSEKTLNAIQVSRVEKGFINTAKRYSSTIVNRYIEVKLSSNFTSIPEVFFSLSDFNVNDYFRGFETKNLEIDRSKFRCNIIFYGEFTTENLNILWVALGS